MLSKILDFLFPAECINCGKIGQYLCKDCKKTLMPHPEICPVCHRHSQHFKVCINCITNKDIYFDGIAIGFNYSGVLKKLILGLKYYHKKDIADFLVDRLNVVYQTNPYLHDADFITYVPSHWFRKYFIKGYNQSQILAKKFSAKTNIPFLEVFKKIKYTKSQTNLNRSSRLQNLSGAFQSIATLSGKSKIIIIDDITTTGSTINELAKTIKTIYPSLKIWGLVLGRHN